MLQLSLNSFVGVFLLLLLHIDKFLLSIPLVSRGSLFQEEFHHVFRYLQAYHACVIQNISSMDVEVPNLDVEAA